MTTVLSSQDPESIRETVRTNYGRIAGTGRSCCGGESPCGAQDPAQRAQSIGYSPEELALLPDGANMGLSCGNPTAIASLLPGEIVLDLGSGGGFDAFVAGPKVGAGGRVIGVDMTAEMIAKARRNLAAYRERIGLDNIEFRLGEIEHLPVADASVDVVISNCVINLSPDKPQVWREIARVLKPGGRVAVSDIALRRPLPEDVREMAAALVGCLAGASQIEDVERMMRDAGLVERRLQPKSGYLDSLASSGDELYTRVKAALPDGLTPQDYATSLDISARKPAATACCGTGAANQGRSHA